MIIPVNSENAREWARMCTLLHGHSDDGDDMENYLEELEESGEEHFLYMLDGRYVGLLDLALRTDYVEGTDHRPVGYVEGVYVEPDCRGRGIAKELIQFAREWSKNKGARELASDAYIDNTVSIAFHNAAGFEEAGRNVHFVMKLD